MDWRHPLLTPDVVIDRCRAAGIPHRADRHRSRHGNRNPQGRPGPEINHLAAAMSGHRRAPRHHRLRQRLARGCRAARFHESTRLYAHPETLAIEDYFGGAGRPCRACGCVFIGSAPRADCRGITCGSCAIIAFRRGSESELDAEGRSRLHPGWHTLSRALAANVSPPNCWRCSPCPIRTRFWNGCAAAGVLGVILPEACASAACCTRTPDRCRNPRKALLPIPVRRLAAMLPPSARLSPKWSPHALRLSKAQRKPAHRRCRADRAGQRKPARPLPIASPCPARSTGCCCLGCDARGAGRMEIPEFPLKRRPRSWRAA